MLYVSDLSSPVEDLADADATPTSTSLGFGSLEGPAEPRDRLVPRGTSTASTGGGGGAGGSGLAAPPGLDQESKDSLPPLPREMLSMRSTRTHRLINTHSDDGDSAVSMVSPPLSLCYFLLSHNMYVHM